MEIRDARVHQSPRLAFYAAFFSLTRHNPPSPLSDYLEVTLRFIYDLSFPLSIKIPSSNVFPVTAFRYVRDLWTFNAAKGTVQYGSAIFICLLILCNFIYIGYLVTFYRTKRSGEAPKGFIMRSMSTHLCWSTGPLLIPYTSVILSYIACSQNCKATWISDLPYIIIFSIILFFHNVLAIIYRSSAFDWNLVSRFLSATLHGRTHFISALTRCVITILFGVIQDDDSIQITYLLVIACIGYQVFLACCYWYEHPFHNIRMNQCFIGIYGISLMASLTVLFSLITNGNGDIVCIGMLIIGSILMIPAVAILSNYRVTTIRESSVSTLKTATNVELKIRQLMQQLQEGRGKKSSSENEEWRVREADIRKEIDSILSIYVKTMRYSFKFNLVWATYVFLFRNNKFLAMQKLRILLTGSPMIFDILPLEIRMRDYAECSTSEEIEAGLASFEEQQRLERHAVDCMSRSITYQARFWATLLSSDYTLSTLQHFTQRINFYSETSRESLQRIISLNPKSPHYRRLYSQFLSSVVNDDAGAKRQLSRAMELEVDSESCHNLADCGKCIIIISGERETLGQILEANSKTCEVFGMGSEDILGKKINLLMARPFSIIHNARLLHYIETKSSDLASIYRKGTIMRGSNGFVFEGDLQIREYANFTLEPSIAFFGLVKPYSVRMFCLVKRADWVIWDISNSFYQFFHPDMQSIKYYELKLTTLFHEFKEHTIAIKEALKENTGAYSFTLRHNESDTHSEFNITVTPLQYYESEFYHVLFERETATLAENQEDVEKEDNIAIEKMDVEAIPNFQRPEKKRSVYYDTVEDEDESEESKTLSEESKELHSTTDEGSSVSNSKSTNLLRLGLLRVSNKLEPIMWHFLLCIVSLLVILSAMGICVQVLWTSLTVNRHMQTLTILSAPVQTGTLTVTYSSVLLNHLLNGSLFGNPSYDSEEEQRIRTELKYYQNLMDSLFTDVFSNQISLRSDEINTIQSSQVMIENYQGSMNEMTLVEAMHQYLIAVTAILAKNKTELEKDNNALQFITSNTKSNIPQVWESICNSILQTEHEYNFNSQQMEMIFMSVAISLVGVMTLIVLLPILYSVYKESVNIYRIFENLEEGNLRDIYSQCIQQLSNIEGLESSPHNIELQDMMEVIASKRSSEEGSVRSRVSVSLSQVLFSRVSLLLLLILALTIAYFLGFYLWWIQMNSTVFNGIDYRVYYSNMRSYYARMITMDAMNFDPHQHLYVINTTDMELWEQQLWLVDNALYFGNPDLNMNTDIRDFPDGNTILESGACSLLSSYPYISNYSNLSQCDTFENDILTQSPHEVTVSFLILSQDLRRFYEENKNETALLEQRIQSLKDLSDQWLQAVNHIYDEWIQGEMTQQLNQAYTVRLVGTVVYILLCIVSIFGVYLPMVRSMNNELQQTRMLLMFIPMEVMEGTKSLRDLVRQIALRLIQRQ